MVDVVYLEAERFVSVKIRNVVKHYRAVPVISTLKIKSDRPTE
jgi:hypothetical protein